jgi:AraC-like DNA-binding protein
MGVGDVALACGYGDLPAFDKAFKRRFGTSPRQWRNDARPGSDPAEVIGAPSIAGLG